MALQTLKNKASNFTKKKSLIVLRPRKRMSYDQHHPQQPFLTRVIIFIIIWKFLLSDKFRAQIYMRDKDRRDSADEIYSFIHNLWAIFSSFCSPAHTHTHARAQRDMEVFCITFTVSALRLYRIAANFARVRERHRKGADGAKERERERRHK